MPRSRAGNQVGGRQRVRESWTGAKSAACTGQVEAADGGEPPCNTAGQGARWAEGNEMPMRAGDADEAPATRPGAEPEEGGKPAGAAADGETPAVGQGAESEDGSQPAVAATGAELPRRIAGQGAAHLQPGWEASRRGTTRRSRRRRPEKRHQQPGREPRRRETMRRPRRRQLGTSHPQPGR